MVLPQNPTPSESAIRQRISSLTLIEEYLPRTEGEGNGYVEGATMEGPGWEGDDREEFGDLPLADGSATFFYQDGEREHVEEDVGTAGLVKERWGEGGRKAARMPGRAKK